MSSYAPSLFSAESYSTAPSTCPSDLPLPQPPPPQQAAPAIKAATIHLPLELPPSPETLQQVDITSLAVDEVFDGMPIGFVVAKMQTLGPSLLTNATQTTLRIPAGPELPSYLPCTLPPASEAIPPTHILAIHAPDSPRTLLVPVHGLLFASHSTALSLISSSPQRQPSYPNHPALPSEPAPLGSAPREAHLPILDLHLPSSLAFPLLQAYLYLQSPALLLASLLPTLTPASQPPKSSSLSTLLNPTPISLSHSLATLPTEMVLRRVSLVHSLWQDVVALGVSDEKLWKCMASAWAVLAGALCVQERRRKEDMSSQVDEVSL